MLRPRLRIPSASNAARAGLVARQLLLQQHQRSMHSMPKLNHDYGESGVPGLFSVDGFHMAWTEYMTHTLNKLNALIAGTDLEGRDTKQILHATARDPDQAPIFNHASMAHNTHFFFKTLTPNPKPIPQSLATDLSVSFSSVETLRRELVLTAASMFGPGFVWLVKTPASTNPHPSTAMATMSVPAGSGAAQYRILTTYLAGTPYPGAHWRLQPADMNTLGADNSAGGFVRSTQRAQQATARPPGALELVPILCLNTWEHTWLRDYGIGGKKAFAEAWWEAIDWDVVAEAAAVRTRPSYQV